LSRVSMIRTSFLSRAPLLVCDSGHSQWQWSGHIRASEQNNFPDDRKRVSLRRLLVANEPSAAGGLWWAGARHPWPSGTTACVLHIIHWPECRAVPCSFTWSDNWQVLLSATDRLGKAGLQSTPKIVEGNPRPWLDGACHIPSVDT